MYERKKKKNSKIKDTLKKSYELRFTNITNNRNNPLKYIGLRKQQQKNFYTKRSLHN